MADLNGDEFAASIMAAGNLAGQYAPKPKAQQQQQAKPAKPSGPPGGRTSEFAGGTAEGGGAAAGEAAGGAAAAGGEAAAAGGLAELAPLALAAL